MFKRIILGSALVAAGFAETVVLQNSPLETQATTLQDVSVPYPYQGNAIKRFVSSEPLQNTYFDDGYQAILVPVAQETGVGFSALGVLSLIASYSFAFAKKAALLILADIPALLLGTFAIFGLCKFTPICTKFSHFKSLWEVQQEFRSLATPERLARASDFVQKAIKKFSSLQGNEDSAEKKEDDKN